MTVKCHRNGHSRSMKPNPLESLGMVSCLHCIAKLKIFHTHYCIRGLCPGVPVALLHNRLLWRNWSGVASRWWKKLMKHVVISVRKLSVTDRRMDRHFQTFVAR